MSKSAHNAYSIIALHAETPGVSPFSDQFYLSNSKLLQCWKMQHFDIAVVGLGALGSAAAWQASTRGAHVIGFEQFELGHVRGASHDTSRIVRTSYDDPIYVALAKSAYEDWAALEKSAGVQLLHITGGLIFLPKNGELTTKQYVQNLKAAKIEHELLDALQVKSRWPQFQIGEDVDAVYTPDTGMVHAAKSVAAMQWLARNNGAVLREQVEVLRLTPLSSGRGGGVVIETSTGHFHANKVILAADAWTNKLLKPLNAEIPLTIMQEQVTYFKPTEPTNFSPADFPVWIHGGDNWFYGFPTFGEPTIKAARDMSHNVMTVEERTFVHSPELQQQLTEFMDGFLPDTGRKVLRTLTCQYAVTPERQFVLGPLERYPDISVALAAGHGFKFAPAIGRVMAELAIDGETKEVVGKFAVKEARGRVMSRV